MRSAAANSFQARKLLGKRLSMLFRIEGDPQHPFSEAVGVLQRIDGDEEDLKLVLARRDGTTVEVEVSKIIKMKTIG